jgi:hypothetical protein
MKRLTIALLLALVAARGIGVSWADRPDTPVTGAARCRRAPAARRDPAPAWMDGAAERQPLSGPGDAAPAHRAATM